MANTIIETVAFETAKELRDFLINFPDDKLNNIYIENQQGSSPLFLGVKEESLTDGSVVTNFVMHI